MFPRALSLLAACILLLTPTLAYADVLNGITGYELGTVFDHPADWEPLEWMEHPGLVSSFSDITYSSNGVDYGIRLLVSTRDGIITTTTIYFDDPTSATASAIATDLGALFADYKVDTDTRTADGTGKVVWLDENGAAAEYVWRDGSLSVLYATADEYEQIYDDLEFAEEEADIAYEELLDSPTLGIQGVHGSNRYPLGQTIAVPSGYTSEADPDYNNSVYVSGRTTYALEGREYPVREDIQLNADGTTRLITIYFGRDPIASEDLELHKESRKVFLDLREQVLGTYAHDMLTVDSVTRLDLGSMGTFDEATVVKDSTGNACRVLRNGRQVILEYGQPVAAATAEPVEDTYMDDEYWDEDWDW